MYNDLGSGSNVDLCVITSGGVEYLRNYEFLQAKTYARQFPVRYPKGTARGWRGRAGAVQRGRAWPRPGECCAARAGPQTGRGSGGGGVGGVDAGPGGL